MFRLIKLTLGCLFIPIAIGVLWFLFSPSLLYQPERAEIHLSDSNSPIFEVVKRKRWTWVPGATERRVELPQEEWEQIAATGDGPGLELLLNRDEATWENLGSKEASEGSVRNVQLIVEVLLRV